MPKMRTRRNEETKVTQARKAKAAPVWKSQIRMTSNKDEVT